MMHRKKSRSPFDIAKEAREKLDKKRTSLLESYSDVEMLESIDDTTNHSIKEIFLEDNIIEKKAKSKRRKRE